MPRVSLVMPVHNGRPYVREAIDSVRRQTYTDWELVIVNDGSTDGTRDVLDAAASEDTRIHVFHEDKIGQYRARNLGAAHAQGTFLGIMDADDLCLPSRLGRQVDFLIAHPDHVLVGGQVELIDSDSRPFEPENSRGQPGRGQSLPLDHAVIDARLMSLAGYWPLVHPTTVFRREAFEAAGGYRESFKAMGDHDLFVRLAEIGRLANLPDVVLKYRRHPDQVTKNVSSSSDILRQRIIRDALLRREMAVPKPLKNLQWRWWKYVVREQLRPVFDATRPHRHRFRAALHVLF